MTDRSPRHRSATEPRHDRYDPRSGNAKAGGRRYLTDAPVLDEIAEIIDEGIVEDRPHYDPHTREFHRLLDQQQPRSLFDQVSATVDLKYDIECAQRSGPVYTVRPALRAAAARK